MTSLEIAETFDGTTVQDHDVVTFSFTDGSTDFACSKCCELGELVDTELIYETNCKG